MAGCGDDGAETADAGTDARPPRVDAGFDGGTDAGPRFVNNCGGEIEPPGPFPAPDAWGPNRGPGGPAASFTEAELYGNCAYLDGGEGDRTDHHNLVTMFDGYLLMPWAPEFGEGGITLWDVSDPCAPVQTGYGEAAHMRESHSIGFSLVNGRWAVVDSLAYDDEALMIVGGVLFWDLSDTSAPVPVGKLDVPGFGYPDAYARVTGSVFWQVPYVYAGGSDNGVYVIDATDPTHPSLVAQYQAEPLLRVGQVQAIGNLLVLTAFEGSRTLLLDISDPTVPQPIPGGDFHAVDGSGNRREAYFTNAANGYVYYARKEGGGGIMVMDIHDPTAPVFAGDVLTDGNGGYVFPKGDLAFTGESNFAVIYDISDLSSITEVTRLDLEGDLDTAVPIGNVVVLSVDDGANENQGSAIAPYATEPDTAPPRVTWAWPPDGSTMLPVTSRFGVTFDEMVDVQSAFPGSVRLYESSFDPDVGRVDAWISAQENIVNVHPRCELKPDTEYTLEIPAGGVVDFNGNAVTEPFVATFRTAP